MEDAELVITTNSLKQSSLSSSWEGGVVPGVEGADNNDYALVIRRWKNRGHDRSMNSAPPCRRQSTNFVDFVNNFKAGITPFRVNRPTP